MKLLELVELALRVIQERLLVMVCMLITAGLFSWAMWLQSVLGAIIATTWGLTIFLPVLFAGRRDTDAQEAAQHPAEPP